MTDESWIPAYRKLYNQGHALAPSKRDPSCRRDAWLDLCQLAQYQPREHAGSHLQRGEVLVAVRTMAQRWGWSKSRVSRFILWLASESMIGTVRGTPHGTVYRIVNYELYAMPGDTERDTDGDTERDASGTRAGQEQEGRKKKTTYPPDFEELWALDRRGSKLSAYRQYIKATPSLVSHGDMMVARRAHIAAASQPRFIKHLERWIRDRRWEGVEAAPEPDANPTLAFVQQEEQRRLRLLGESGRKGAA